VQRINQYTVVRWLPVSEGVKLRWTRRLLERQHDREMKIARATKNAEHIERGEDNWRYEFFMHADEEQAYYSRKLLERARHLRVLIPAYYDDKNELTGDYERSNITDKIHLSLQGENKVRAAIRDEEKHRSERWARRIPYLTALTGLIGAITGLLAVVEKLHP
jgi:hypothetical protein